MIHNYFHSPQMSRSHDVFYEGVKPSFTKYTLDDGAADGGAQERVHLSHELGHCLTGSFYSVYTAVDCRQRHENRADKWAVRKLIPVEQLDDAVAEGCTELWELADRFGVTEDLMRKAVCLYVHGNLAAELYF